MGEMSLEMFNEFIGDVYVVVMKILVLEFFFDFVDVVVMFVEVDCDEEFVVDCLFGNGLDIESEFLD